MTLHTVGSRLSELRKSTALSTLSFGQQIGVKKATLYGWEKMTRLKISLSLFGKIAERKDLQCYLVYVLTATPSNLCPQYTPPEGAADSIGGRLKEVRNLLGVSRLKCSELAGISDNTIKGWEQGYRDKVPVQLAHSILTRQEMKGFQPYLMYLMIGKAIDIGDQSIPVAPDT